MTRNYDIVARLRDTTSGYTLRTVFDEAADEIERLRYTLRTVFDEAADEIERLRAERDEARRLWCIDIGELYSSSPLSLAKERGWDCFKDGNP